MYVGLSRFSTANGSVSLFIIFTCHQNTAHLILTSKLRQYLTYLQVINNCKDGQWMLNMININNFWLIFTACFVTSSCKSIILYLLFSGSWVVPGRRSSKRSSLLGQPCSFIFSCIIFYALWLLNKRGKQICLMNWIIVHNMHAQCSWNKILNH